MFCRRLDVIARVIGRRVCVACSTQQRPDFFIFGLCPFPGGSTAHDMLNVMRYPAAYVFAFVYTACLHEDIHLHNRCRVVLSDKKTHTISEYFFMDVLLLIEKLYRRVSRRDSNDTYDTYE